VGADPATALIAPDSFKGTLDAAAVAAALGAGFEAAAWARDACPLGDGGEGTSDALLAAAGGERVRAIVTGPIGQPIEAEYALLDDRGTAVVEVAAASGLALLTPEQRDPVGATSRGTGELIALAAHDAAEVLIAVGGSATSDGGAGALAALEDAGGIGSARLVCLCDVATPWELATRTFAPQKGADPETLAELEQRMETFALGLPRDPRGVPRTGAAGGIAGALWAVWNAELRPGAEYVCDAVGFDARAAAATLVVTGEGRLDQTTLEGKVVAEVARRCGEAGRPLHAVVGQDCSDDWGRGELGLASIHEAGSVAGLERAGHEIADLYSVRGR
jgi:glycerate 2-kinase